jgi:hypothetical protein
MKLTENSWCERAVFGDFHRRVGAVHSRQFDRYGRGH